MNEREAPTPQGSEVLLKILASGVCHSDLHIWDGYYEIGGGKRLMLADRGIKLPLTMGHENVGEVVAVGSQVTRFSPGSRVMSLVGGGAQATMAVVEESHALAVPAALTWPEAGGFPEVFCTAFDALFTRADLRMGERVLISGAAGGVGTAGVQLAATTGACVN